MKDRRSSVAVVPRGISPEYWRHLRRLLGGTAFIVLAVNPGNGREQAYEAWAYEGPLNFDEASPICFGLGRDPVAALDALAYQLKGQRLPRKGRPGVRRNRFMVQIDRRELATILGALRFHQAENLQGSAQIPDHNVLDVASDGGTLKPLSHTEIDRLCQKLNCGDPRTTRKGAGR